MKSSFFLFIIVLALSNVCLGQNIQGTLLAGLMNHKATPVNGRVALAEKLGKKGKDFLFSLRKDVEQLDVGRINPAQLNAHIRLKKDGDLVQRVQAALGPPVNNHELDTVTREVFRVLIQSGELNEGKPVQVQAEALLRAMGATDELFTRIGNARRIIQTLTNSAETDPSEEVRYRVVWALGDWEWFAFTAEGMLAKVLLKDCDSFVRERAANALRNVGVGEERTVKALITATSDSELLVRESAKHALFLLE